MPKYVFPAVLTPEENGAYSVRFPDINGCYTSGANLADALFMAEDALALMLYDFEVEKRRIPAPSNEKDILLHNGEISTLIACDTLKYQRMNNKKAVKRTVSLPAWLNDAAIERGLNFSQVLQDSLRQIIL